MSPVVSNKRLPFMACPCCLNSTVRDSTDPILTYQDCFQCGHRWVTRKEGGAVDYGKLCGRNIPETGAHARKMQDRMADIEPHLRPDMMVLEIGCAEGSLGAIVRNSFAVQYTGIELSEDAMIAARVLDRVLRSPASAITGEQFDLLLSFHVLEHIADVAGELAHWRRLLVKSGRLIVEVPNQAGHRLLDVDLNPEHLHQFSPASLSALLHHAGFEIERLESGHWESSVYSDSLRVIARASLSDTERREQLLHRFADRLPQPFAVWGVGGDFRCYVLPLLDSLPVAALLDNNVEWHGTRYRHLAVEGYDPLRHQDLTILVSSVRHRESILKDLASRGIPLSRVVSLDDIFGIEAK